MVINMVSIIVIIQYQLYLLNQPTIYILYLVQIHFFFLIKNIFINIEFPHTNFECIQ